MNCFQPARASWFATWKPTKRRSSSECGGRIRFERDYDPSIPELQGDKSKLIQAALNVMRNAMQALALQRARRDAD